MSSRWSRDGNGGLVEIRFLAHVQCNWLGSSFKLARLRLWSFLVREEIESEPCVGFHLEPSGSVTSSVSVPMSRISLSMQIVPISGHAHYNAKNT